MVYRVYVEKKAELANEAASLLGDIRTLLGVTSAEKLRIINRYDVENIDEKLFSDCCRTVFSEPQLDIVTDSLSTEEGDTVFAVEYLPGQFDQRADSAAQCIQIISQGERPDVKSAAVYVISGDLSDADIAAIKKYVINPVESREASLELPATIRAEYTIPESVETLAGFNSLDRAGLDKFIEDRGLAMDSDDIAFCQEYFRSEQRDPTITEIKMIK